MSKKMWAKQLEMLTISPSSQVSTSSTLLSTTSFSSPFWSQRLHLSTLIGPSQGIERIVPSHISRQVVHECWPLGHWAPVPGLVWTRRLDHATQARRLERVDSRSIAQEKILYRRAFSTTACETNPGSWHALPCRITSKPEGEVNNLTLKAKVTETCCWKPARKVAYEVRKR